MRSALPLFFKNNGELFSTFGYAEGTFAREDKRKMYFSLFSAHLFVPLR